MRKSMVGVALLDEINNLIEIHKMKSERGVRTECEYSTTFDDERCRQLVSECGGMRQIAKSTSLRLQKTPKISGNEGSHPHDRSPSLSLHTHIFLPRRYPQCRVRALGVRRINA